MASAWTNNCEGGTAGATVTVANSGGASGTAWSLVDYGTNLAGVSGSLTYSTAAAYRGTLGIKLGPSTTGDGGGGGFIGAVGTPTIGGSSQRLRFYCKLTGYPTPAGYQFIQVVDNTGDLSGYWVLDQDGKLVFVQQADNNLVLSTTNGLPLNTWLRIEVIANPGTTGADGRLKLCYAIGDGPAIETVTKNTVNLGYNGGMSRFAVGKDSYNDATPAVYFDEFAGDRDVSTTAFIGPSSLNRFKAGPSTIGSLRKGTSTVTAVYAGASQLWP